MRKSVPGGGVFSRVQVTVNERCYFLSEGYIFLFSRDPLSGRSRFYVRYGVKRIRIIWREMIFFRNCVSLLYNSDEYPVKIKIDRSIMLVDVTVTFVLSALYPRRVAIILRLPRGQRSKMILIAVQNRASYESISVLRVYVGVFQVAGKVHSLTHFSVNRIRGGCFRYSYCQKINVCQVLRRIKRCRIFPVNCRGIITHDIIVREARRRDMVQYRPNPEERDLKSMCRPFEYRLSQRQ